MRKLNLGCGYQQPDGWINADKFEYGQYYKVDVMAGLPLNWNEKFDVVVMHHVLQMVTYASIPLFLGEVKKVMKPGAVLRVSVPDLNIAIENYQKGLKTKFPIVDEAEESLAGKFCAYVMWYSEARMVYTPAFLSEVLFRNGFDKPQLVDYDESMLDTRPDESIFMEAIK